MCGFVALFNRDRGPVELPVLERMGNALRHRGPDGEGHHLDREVGLYHQRLAVIDIAGGDQPMSDPSGQYTVVFNGEIYNYVELRDLLEARGVRFRTRSDTEVLLWLYILEGEACVERLNGMFAFVVVDRTRQVAVMARDPFGVKPLYYHLGRDHLVWASEIKAILQHPAIEARVSEDSLAQYFTLQYVLDEDTLFAGIRKLSPGRLQVLSLGDWSIRLRRYWTPSYVVDPDLDEASAREELDALIRDSIRVQVRSDVPVGAHLSGGIDSSLVTTLAAPLRPAPFKAFHGCFDAGPRYDESHFARQVAHHSGIELIEVPIDGRDFSSDLPRLVWYMDEPAAGPGIYPQYKVSQIARQHVTVALGGQGGDELYCGYARYLVAYLEQAIKGAIRGRSDEGQHGVTLGSIVPNLPFLEQYQPMLRRFWSQGLFESPDRRYFSLIDRSEGATGLFSTGFREQFARARVFERFRAVFHHPDTTSYISQMRAFDRIASLPSLLHVEDRVSMAVGLESRVPLLDTRIAELLDRLSPAALFGGGHLKHLLREVAAQRIPPVVAHRRDKMGFPFPLDEWVGGVAREFVHDTLLSERCRHRGYFDPGAVERLLRTQEPFSRKLWGLLCVELWFRIFIDGETP